MPRRALFSGWHEQDAARLFSVVNLFEVLVAPAADSRRLRAAREAVSALGVAVVGAAEAERIACAASM